VGVACPACLRTVVAGHGKVCATCRDKGCGDMTQAPRATRALEWEVDAYEVLCQSLRLSREALSRLEAQMMALNAGGELAVPGLRRDFSRELQSVGKTVSALAKEARQYELSRKTAAKKLTREEQVRLIGEFFEGLPAEHKRSLIEDLTRRYNARAA
jgi:hypothetical protein